MADDMADWPQALRINGAACDLAQALYAARCAAYGGWTCPFTELAPHVRDVYILLAATAIKQMRPRTDGALPETVSPIFGFAVRNARREFQR